MNWATEGECEVSGLDPEIVEAQSEGSAPVLEVRKSLLEVRIMLKLGIEDGALARGGLTRLPVLGEEHVQIPDAKKKAWLGYPWMLNVCGGGGRVGGGGN